ncbi:MAG: hypothetical protein OXG52_10365 [bacterium]|nr:hypothetical protein [bacterium]
MPFTSPTGAESEIPDPSRPGAARFAGLGDAGPQRPRRPASDRPSVPPPAAGGRSAPQGEPAGPAGAKPPVGPVTARSLRRRIPELAVGVVLVGLGAIGALMLAGREDSRVSVLVWADDVTRGQTVTADDLAVAGLGVDVPVDVVGVSAAAEVIGRTVAFDARAGGFVSGALLEAGSVIPSDFAVVGLRLGAGRYPVSTLAAGDVVDLLTSEPMAGWEDPVVVSGVEVYDVQWLGSGEGGDALVSLLVPRSVAARVVAAADAGPRLAEVAL